MKELHGRGSYVLFPKRFLRRRRPNIHAKPACRSKKRLTNQEFMPSDYYTYIPFITATPKEDFIPVGNINRQQVGGRKLLPTSRIVLYIAKTMKNRTIPFVLVWFCVSISSLFLMALNNIRILCLGFLCFMLFNLSDAWAQSAESRAAEGQTEIKPLKVGEKVPEEFWTREHIFYTNGDTVRKTLQEYRGVPLLLDFWATWCISCIEGFPKLSYLQERYDRRLNVLLVNSLFSRDDYTRIDKMPNDILRTTNLRTIYGDEYLRGLFDFVMIPQYVWIDPKGRFVGMTMSDFVHDGQVEHLLNLYRKYENTK